MTVFFRRRRHRWGAALFLLIGGVYAPAAQVVPTPPAQTTYVFFRGTHQLARLSAPEVFQQVVEDVQEYLKANDIATIIRIDDSTSGAELPLYAVQDMARGAKASHLLYVLVDRPVMKWLKVTVRCYDASGQEIWKEEASDSQGWSPRWSPGKGQRNALSKLHAELNQHIGQAGLIRASTGLPSPVPASPPVVADVSQPQPSSTPAVAGSGAATDTKDDQTIRLASGTPVHLLLAETLSSKTANPGAMVKLQVLGDVKVGDLIVIANKAAAVGTIETAQGAGRAWRAGHLLLRLKTVTLLDQRQQPLHAWNASKGADTEAGIEWTNAIFQSYGLALFALPFAPLQHGNQAFLYKGTALEAVTDGDILLPRDVIEKAQPKAPGPRNGSASVTVYYPDFEHGSSVDIWCGTAKVGHLHRGERLTLTLPPARYWFRFGPGTRAVLTPLDAESGGEQYLIVRVYRAPSQQLEVHWREHLSVVEHDIGELQSADTKLAKSKPVLTADKVDLVQLQADPHGKKKK